jgi:phosphoribosylanthranilate isomerase
MWIKVCGLTRREDALSAAAAGASAVGFVFWDRSPRRVAPADARRIGRALPAGVERAGVFVDASRDAILRTFEEADLTWVQLQGAESLGFARSLGVPWVKALRAGGPGGAGAASEAAAFAAEAHGRRLLLDAYREGVPGGTGVPFDWETAARMKEALPAKARMIVAGGLTAGNVGSMIARVRPGGVDVSGGVEASPGIKDASKIAEFAAAVRRAAGGAAGAGTRP